LVPKVVGRSKLFKDIKLLKKEVDNADGVYARYGSDRELQQAMLLW